MELFLGYDPGGAKKHGVVAVKVAHDGSYGDLDASVLRDATQVRAWLDEHLSAVALGIDTLLAWSWSGSRPCDNLLRAHYNTSTPTNDLLSPDCLHCRNSLRATHLIGSDAEAEPSRSVVAQNSLYSSMTLNGAMVATAAREARPDIPLIESHPKLLLRGAGAIGSAREHLLNGYVDLLHRGKLHTPKTGEPRVHEDHCADAFVAAWSASRWYYGEWPIDLYEPSSNESSYCFPAGRAIYPWPERIR